MAVLQVLLWAEQTAICAPAPVPYGSERAL